MGFIFTSYSRQDTNIVDNLASRLKSDGFEVWIDRENIKGGDQWRKQIVKAIHTADAFVLMLSPNSTASDNVRKEVDLAENAKRKLFPFVLAPVDLPEELLYQLSGIQWIEFYKDPVEKYQELVELLREHQKSLPPAPETRKVEVVISGKEVKKFGAEEQEALLKFMTQKAETPRASLSLAGLAAGSVHAFINMPADAAYTLKTAALNRDASLLKYGIDAMRLDGEEEYVLVQTGEIGPLNLKPRRGFPTRPLLTVIGVGIILTILYSMFFNSSQAIRPRTPTETITATPTKTLEPTRTRTPTPTPTKTLTPTVTLNAPPGAPEIVSPLQDSTVLCEGKIFLDWQGPYDASGIAAYEVSLDEILRNQQSNIIVEQVRGSVTELDVTNYVYKYCGRRLAWKVRAQDGAGVWGEWSANPVFLTQNNLPPAPVINIDQIQPNGNVSCYASPKLFWDEPGDSNGIINYQLVIDIYNYDNGQWNNAFNDYVTSNSYNITPIVSKSCGTWLRARVKAQDGLGDWGEWSSWLEVFIELPTPG